jgi:hypothetical protein
MSTLDGRFWMSWVGAVAMMVASGGLMACSDDDDEEAQTVVVVQTNRVTGVVTTNVVVVADAGGAAPAAVAADVDIAGVWNGTRSSGGGSAQLQFFFVQNNGVLSGQYQDTSGFEGNLTGEIDGDDIQFVVALTAGAPGASWIFTGAANAAGTQLQGKMNTGGGLENIQASR